MATTTNTMIAKVTGVGPESSVPDNVDAVDAEIYEGGEWIGDVTLIPDHEGELNTWGEIDHWASGRLQTRLYQIEWEDRGEIIAAVLDAVRAAAAAAAAAE